MESEQIRRALGKTIAAKRKMAKCTQAKASEHLGIGAEAYSRIERGVNGISIEKLFKLAALFGTEVYEFFLSPDCDTKPDKDVGQSFGALSEPDRLLVAELIARLSASQPSTR